MLKDARAYYFKSDGIKKDYYFWCLPSLVLLSFPRILLAKLFKMAAPWIEHDGQRMQHKRDCSQYFKRFKTMNEIPESQKRNSLLRTRSFFGKGCVTSHKNVCVGG